MNNEKKIILFTFVAHFLFHFYEIAFPVLAIPLMLSLKMDLKGVLELGFPMYLLFGLSSLPWGYFADRFSNRRALMICFFGGSLGAFLTAFSSSGTSFMLSLAVIGIFACICHPAGMGLISQGVRNRGMALGINSVAGSIGLSVGPFLAGLLNWLAGWQMAYLTIGIFSLLWGIAIIFVKIDETPIEGLHRPQDKPLAARFTFLSDRHTGRPGLPDQYRRAAGLSGIQCDFFIPVLSGPESSQYAGDNDHGGIPAGFFRLSDRDCRTAGRRKDG